MASNIDRDALIDLIADGAVVDWTVLLDACRTPDERALIEQLRVVSAIGRATVVRPPGAADPSGPPRSWGPLDVFESLGRGAYGRVFRARDPQLDREVALKLVEHPADGDAPFVREAQLLARIRHPNVVVVHGASVHDGTPGLWMELIRGRSLRTIVGDQGPFGPREAALIALDVCAALAAVHRAGLLHRDIKANNVMREVGGRIVLMDFGAGVPLAGDAARDGGMTGTPLYMAPELFAGGDASAATELYALGVLLFFLVTGEYPVAGRSIEELRAAHANGTRRWLREARPDIPAMLAQVIDRALNPDPAARFRTAADMEQALAATLDVHGRTAARDAPGASSWRRWVARPIPAWVALLAAPILIAGSVLVVRSVDRSRAASGDAAVVPVRAAAGGYMPRGRQALSPAQWEVIDGHQELAGSLADRDEWAEAATHYQKVADLLLSQVWQDEPYRAHLMAMLAWAQMKAGNFDAARTNLDLALYKLSQEGGDNHPLRATMEMASAVERYARKERRGAAGAMARAIQIRRATLVTAGVALEDRSGSVDVNRLTEALARHPVDADEDGDWLPDAIEAAIGLNPAAGDTDADGIPDGEEDLNGDGINNAFEWAIVADPRHAIAHFGGLDPERAGFRRERDFEGTAVDGGIPAWRVVALRQGFYYRKLTQSQKNAATSRGWRLMSVGTLHQGLATVNMDLVSPARFLQNFYISSDQRLMLQLVTNVIPREGSVVPVADAPGRWPATETVFDPARHAATVMAPGKRLASDYRGSSQFLEDWGVVVGATTLVGTASPGQADFTLVLVQIR